MVLERKAYADYLRVLATFAIMLLHLSIQGRDLSGIIDKDWIVFNIYNSMVRWGVPVFIMISGSLFLNRDIPIKKIYSKYIFRLVCAFIFWDFLYIILSENTIKYGLKYGISSQMGRILKGHYHMWFIYMIVGMYMGIPIYKKIISDEETVKYFMALSGIFAFILPWGIKIFGVFSTSTFSNKIVSGVSDVLTTMGLELFAGYSFYFVLGYYIDSKRYISDKTTKLIYILGFIGFISTALLEIMVAVKTNEVHQYFYGNNTVNVALEAIAVFCYLRNRTFNDEKKNDLMSRLSKYSFGAYLVHALIIEVLDFCFGITTKSFNTMVSVPLLGVVVFVASFGISAIFNCVPFLKKYVV